MVNPHMKNPLSDQENSNVLIVEDEQAFAAYLEIKLKKLGYNVIGKTSSGESAILLTNQLSPDLIMMDISLEGDLDGINTSAKILSKHDIPIIYLTADSDSDTLHRAKVTNPHGFLLKPITEKELSISIEIALYKHRMKKKLKESEYLFRTLTENSLNGIYIIQDYKFIYLNSSALNILGYQLKELINVPVFDIIYEDDKKIAAENIRERISGKSDSIQYSLRLRRKDGSIVYCEVRGREIDYLGKPSIMGTVIDITQRKLYEEQLIAAKETAERSDKLKSEFVAQISHEIRTPLNNMLTYISLLEDEIKENMPQSIKMSFSILDRNAKRLIRTFDLLMNLSKIQTGNFEAKMEAFDIHSDLIEDLLIEFFPKAKSKNLDFIYENTCSCSKTVADKFSISQIIANLVDNAIKFTETGKITLKLSNCDKKVLIEVKDTGVGISEEYLPKIFKPFSQEQNSKIKNLDGAGLGLSLVKKYAELNNAQIKIKSKKGKGSRFMLYLDENPLTFY